MKADNSTIQHVKDEIQGYYKNRLAIKNHEKRLERLYMHLKNIEEDIDSSKLNHCLESDIRGISYDNVIVMGGALPSSSMDNAIERIYKNLERDHQNTFNEILETRSLIRKLENKCSEMELYLGMLSDENRQMLNMKYQDSKSIYHLSLSLNVSEATISRNLKNVYTDFAKLKAYYKNHEGVLREK